MTKITERLWMNLVSQFKNHMILRTIIQLYSPINRKRQYDEGTKLMQNHAGGAHILESQRLPNCSQVAIAAQL
jgi:hypothetical protein